MNNKIFISHADIILDKIYDSEFNLVKQDGGGCNWNDLYNLSLMGETCYAFGSCGNDEEGKIALDSLKRAGVNTDNVLIDDTIRTDVIFYFQHPLLLMIMMLFILGILRLPIKARCIFLIIYH